MGLFNKKEKHNDYVAFMRKTASDFYPEMSEFDMTLTTGSKDFLDTLKKDALDMAKSFALKAVARTAGLRARTRFEGEPVFITCFKGNDLYFFCIGNGLRKSVMEIEEDEVFHFHKRDIERIDIKRKKVTIHFHDGGEFMISIGINPSTIYALPEEDKRFLSFMETLT